MRVGDQERGSRQVQGRRGGGGVCSTQGKRHEAQSLTGAVGIIAGNSTERARAQIVENPEAPTERGAPVWPSPQLIRNAHSRRNVAVGRLIKRCSAWEQSERCGIVQPRYREGIV